MQHDNSRQTGRSTASLSSSGSPFVRLLETVRNLGIILRSNLSSVCIEAGNARDAPPVRYKAGCGAENAEPILHAALEVDRRSFLEVFRGTGYFTNPEAKHDGLRDHLVVEDEIVRILQQWKCFKKLSRKGPEAGVILGQLHAQKQVLKRSEKTVGNVFVTRHSALDGSTRGKHPGAEDGIGFAGQ